MPCPGYPFVSNPEVNCTITELCSQPEPEHNTRFISRQQDLQTTVSDVFLLDSVYEVIWPIIADLSLTLGFYICFVGTLILLQPPPQASSEEKPKWETAELKEFSLLLLFGEGLSVCISACFIHLPETMKWYLLRQGSTTAARAKEVARKKFQGGLYEGYRLLH